jgi:G3E family GTPase
MNKKIPITILTGFLGSGKTTLLNHIIRNANGRKIDVVENEFGSTGIDADLIEKSTEEIVEISNGCICCTVRQDFMEAIERLLVSGREIDHIIIEASSMSELLPIAQSFLMNDMS